MDRVEGIPLHRAVENTRPERPLDHPESGASFTASAATRKIATSPVTAPLEIRSHPNDLLSGAD
jgi:hypothetical protein